MYTSPQLYESAAERRALLARTRARAQFARDAADARAWLADKLAKLTADQGQGTSSIIIATVFNCAWIYSPLPSYI